MKRGDFEDGLQYWGKVRGRDLWVTPEDFDKRMTTLLNARARYLEVNRERRRETNAAYARSFREKNKPDVNPLLHFKKKVRHCNQRMVKFGTNYSEFGFSSKDLVAHLSSSFEPGMHLGNYGHWEIDHIIPLDIAKTQEEIVKLNRLDNLAPLWKKDNAVKRNKILTCP